MTTDTGSAAMAVGADPSRVARTCLDCPAPISVKSKGRCRRCTNAVIGPDPARRAKASSSMKRRMACPVERARLIALRSAGIARCMEDPAFVERKRELGRRYGSRNIGACHEPEARAKAGRAISAVKLAHIPPAYRPLYRSLLSQDLRASERERIVRAQIERDQERGRSEVMANAAEMQARHEREKGQRF